MREAGAVVCRVPLKFIFHLNEVFISCFICVYIIKISPFSYFSVLGLKLESWGMQSRNWPQASPDFCMSLGGCTQFVNGQEQFPSVFWWYGDDQEEMEGLMV